MAFLLLVSGHLRADFSEAVVAKAKEATVMVVIFDGNGQMNGLGSGFVVNKRGDVITNHHVVESADSVECWYLAGTTLSRRNASVVHTRSSADLAVIRMENMSGVTPLAVASSKLKSAQRVMSVGHPGTLIETSAKTGQSSIEENADSVLSKDEASLYDPATFTGDVGKLMPLESEGGGSYAGIAHGAKISQGNSGGPLIDEQGRVVGINVAVSTLLAGATDYSYAIEASELRDFCSDVGVSLKLDGRSLNAESGEFNWNFWIILLMTLAVMGVAFFWFYSQRQKAKFAGYSAGGAHPSPGQAPPGVAAPPMAEAPRPAPPQPVSSRMILRGRDLQGNSFELGFSSDDFSRAGGTLVLGRSGKRSHLVLSHDSVSRQHLSFRQKGGDLFAEDLNSANGTTINGGRLGDNPGGMPLRPGDRIKVGEVDFVYDQA